MQVPSSWKIIAFTGNLILGLGVSQGIGAVLSRHTYHVWEEVVQALTMWCLSFIMIRVGFEFTVDKGSLSDYGWDYLIAMTAAGFPWIFVGIYFLVAIGRGISMEESLLIARFAAPTSAGILFSMLEGAGLKETWLFSKARVLAIFDDLDTIILMIPLKVVLVGFKWELVVVVAIMLALLVLAWNLLHRVPLPHSWYWTLFYAAVVSVGCKVLHHMTHHSEDMDPIHIEVLLPAFVLGCIIDTPGARQELKLQRQASELKRGRRSSKPGTGNEIQPVRIQVSECRAKAKDDDSLVRMPSRSRSSIQSSLSVVPQPLHPEWVDNEDGQLEFQQDDKVPDPLPGLLMQQASPLRQRREAVESLAEQLEMAEEALEDTAKGPEESSLPFSPSLCRSSRNVNVAIQAPEDGEEQVESHMDHMVHTTISLVFMVLVGLSMPLLVGPNADDSGSDLSPLELVGHIVMVSILMILGKMFPIVCYRDEANIQARLALCLGMCPRGEVGASIIVLSLQLGIRGPAVLVAMGALAVNLVFSGGFIAAVKFLLRSSPHHDALQP